jgi:hypothetical protein
VSAGGGADGKETRSAPFRFRRFVMRKVQFLAIGVGVAMMAASSVASAAVVEGNHDANRYTKALNLLESKGYTKFSDFHRTGDTFQAQVTHDGKTMTVTIDPDAGLVHKAM